MAERTFTAVFERDGEWWLASAEELPAALTQGATLDEARANLRDAIQLVLEEQREHRQHEADGAAPYIEEITVSV